MIRLIGKRKIRFLTNVKITSLDGELHIMNNAKLYYHPKGVNGARSSHLDINHPELFNVVGLKRGGIYVKAKRIDDWIEITIPNQNKRLIGIAKLKFKSPEFAHVFNEHDEWVWLGAKEGGLIIGLKRDQSKMLDSLALNLIKAAASF